MMDDNLIILGNLRSNPNVRVLIGSYRYERYDCALTPTDITVKELSPKESARLDKRGFRYERVGKNIRLVEDGKKESIVLVTRGPAFNVTGVATFILANQGRGVHAVAKEFLTNQKNWSVISKQLNLPEHLPPEFQMLFHVDLRRQEARYGDCTAILYRGYA